LREFREVFEMKKAFFCTVKFIIFTGCQSSYTHPIKDAKDFDRDLRECEKMTKHHASIIMDEEMKKCLQLSGWMQRE